jgi:hypothetical protein
MPLSRFLAPLFLFASASLYAVTAESVYADSAKLFAFDNLRFTVHSSIETDSSVNERNFIVAKESKNGDSSLLIRFESPNDIRCTAILVCNDGNETTNYLYFPALNRVRIIPQHEEENEVIGLGISYSELDAKGGEFAPLEEIDMDGTRYFKVTKKRGSTRSVYFINMATSIIRKIEVYTAGKLQKEVVIEQITQVNQRDLIMRWFVNDVKKNKRFSYWIDEKSISSKLTPSLFYKNRLQRCTF